MDIFDELWDALAKGGHCDERGGAEYERVKDAWFKRGYLMALLGFIIYHANEVPQRPANWSDSMTGPGG